MAVFRIEKTRDYTVMSNHHLKDRALTLKSKGLLSMMLSLPEDWNYTTRGLAAICREGVDSIGTALKELERAGYIVRNQLRDGKGKIVDVEYIIYETPHKPDAADPDTVRPDTENPDMDRPDMADPCLEDRPQLNINQPITQKQNTNSQIHQRLALQRLGHGRYARGFGRKRRVAAVRRHGHRGAARGAKRPSLHRGGRLRRGGGRRLWRHAARVSRAVLCCAHGA